MKHAIAIVGMACRYPDADTPGQLWENVLAKRRAFRRLPQERLSSSDYFSEDRSQTDKTYMVQGAVLEGFEFDRERFRVPGHTFRSADMAHWLALQVAADALDDAGWPDAKNMPRDATGVLLGNTLTGEFSRANVMRLRWPYVKRVIDAALTEEDWSASARREFLERLEPQYKAPFPEVGGETLAGGLANTIAGRICNQFDLHGGGYTVDGACASSLLAVSQAASALTAGDLDVALAGGVDLSLDPFELVGFARLGALAPHQMRIYDERSAGFWPGEGCGVVVLMREEDAIAQGKRIYATLQGWGVSSDGSGGLTRPEVEGQLLAVQRAYKRAEYGADSVAYFEGHGTGTAVGDPAEIQVLSRAIREAAGVCPQDVAGEFPIAALGSIKANIGHTKAAAGTAGLIKAALAVHHRVLPPTTACTQPHALLRDDMAALRVLQQAEAWPDKQAVRAGVSAMGFGGINTHVTLAQPSEATTSSRARHRRVSEAALGASRSSQDSELFCLRSDSTDELRQTINTLLSYAEQLSLSQLTDLATTLAKDAGEGSIRAAVLAEKPEQLVAGLQTLEQWLTETSSTAFRTNKAQDVFLDFVQTTAPRVGLLFPGQASPSYLTGGAWSNRFAAIEALYGRVAFARNADPRHTAVAQPAICVAERAGMLALQHWGIVADVAIGHSVGELAALHWAGVYDEDALLRIAQARGSCMAHFGERHGAMASIAADPQRAAQLVHGTRVVVAGMNAPEQTVISGDSNDMQEILQRAAQQGIATVELRVSHAFHSPHMQPAAEALHDMLNKESWQPPQRRVVSTITGTPVTQVGDLTERLVAQLEDPVRFTEALAVADPSVDLWIECGPGGVLSGLVRQQSATPVIALDASSAALGGLLRAFAAAWTMGADIAPAQLFADRFTRPFELDWQPVFFTNPCELAPVASTESNGLPEVAPPSTGMAANAPQADQTATVDTSISALDTVRQLVADQLELPMSTVHENSQLLTELHLNSITISEIVARAARNLGLQPPQAVTEFANASVGDIAEALNTLRKNGGASHAAKQRIPDGVDHWLRTFQIEWTEQALVATTNTAADKSTGTKTDLRTDTSANSSIKGKRGNWKVVAEDAHPMAARLQQAFGDDTPGHGVVVCMPTDIASCCGDMLLHSAQEVLARGESASYIVVQDTHHQGAPGGGFARTLHLENPQVRVCVVDVPWDHPDAAQWVLQEAAATRGFSEARYDNDGKRRVPRLRLAHQQENAATPLGSDDVLCVTGGGKGIAAECALELARQTGVALILMGRSHPEEDDELANNLQRLQASGARVHYARADVSDADAVGQALEQAQEAMGRITAVLHGAGINQPQLIATLDGPSFRRTFAPKVVGLRNVLQAVDAESLRVLITFSSIIGRTGLPGEADYALANEWLSHLTERFQKLHPECLCLALEWSVWSGSGMGERLGRIETLRQQGIAAIPTDQGVAMLLDLLQRPPSTPTVVVAGRFGAPDTVHWHDASLPLLRFVETPRVHYPGVELVVDAVLSAKTDPYLQDHIVQKQPLFPAVMGLEAMAQVAMTLHGGDQVPVFEDVVFQRPVVVEPNGTRTIRLAALQTKPGVVSIVLRSDANDFAMDHFRAVCRFDRISSATSTGFPAIASDTDTAAMADVATNTAARRGADPDAPASKQWLSLDPQNDLYDGKLLFHQGRFQRVEGYRALRAQACDADLMSDGTTEWFGRYMPRTLALGDPAARDAAIHAIQACIPHARLLPMGVDRIISGTLKATEAHRVRALERSHTNDEYVYDMIIEDRQGNIVERWEGLRLRRMEAIARDTPWRTALFGPYMERRLQELLVNPPSGVALLRDQAQTAVNSDAALLEAVGGPVTIWRRPDGQPQVDGTTVSASHSQGYTLAMAGQGRVGCDLQEITERPETTWNDLLGPERLALAKQLATNSRCDLDTAATQIWSAVECLKKAGVPTDSPLTLQETQRDGWTCLHSGLLQISTCVTSLHQTTASMAVAFLTENDTGSERTESRNVSV